MNESIYSDAGIDGKEAVYARLGAIVRSLHDALRELGAEQVLAEAVSEFPSARERLLHIGRLTEKAANTVLNKVEEASPVQERLAAEAGRLNDEWNSAGVTEALRPLTDKTVQFLASVQEGCNMTRAGLSDMMMAQDFQDLTGQLIKKVVVVLERTEKDLLKLLIDAAPEGTVSEIKKEEMMAGPGAVGGVALDQGAVDDLLADLGF
jgi:chemotaxis protein CheZ